MYYEKKSSQISASQLLEKYMNGRFVKPASISPRNLLEFERLAYSILPKEYELLELSPTSPFGTCSVIADISQNNIITTSRNSEVVSDSTNVMALEIAARRKELFQSNPKTVEKISLCSSHRLLRTQKYQGNASFPHFRVLSLCTGGRDMGSFRFETETALQHIRYYLDITQRAIKTGYNVKSVTVKISLFNSNRKEFITRHLVEPLSEQYPEFVVCLDSDKSKSGYYKEMGIQILMGNDKESDLLIVDGGVTDWTQKLLSNKKERMFISALGSERFIFCFQ